MKPHVAIIKRIDVRVFKILLLVCTLMATNVVDAAPGWRVDTAKSRLGFTAIQAGAKFDGEFRKFSADIRFDGKDLANSRFVVEVDMASVDTLSKDRDDMLRSSDMFDVARWRVARFVTTGFTHKGGSAYEAEGKLTIRDVTHTIRLPFTFKITAEGSSQAATLRGGVTIHRLDYGVGQGDLKDTMWVGDEVGVKFSLRIIRK